MRQVFLSRIFGMSNRDFSFGHLEDLRFLGFGRKPLADRLADVFQGLLAGAAPGAQERQARFDVM
jgi:hypothetical protein